MNEGSCRVQKKDGVEELAGQSPKLGGWFKGVIGAIAAFALVLVGIVAISMAFGHSRERVPSGSGGARAPSPASETQRMIESHQIVLVTKPIDLYNVMVGTEWFDPMPNAHADRWARPMEPHLIWQRRFNHDDSTIKDMKPAEEWKKGEYDLPPNGMVVTYIEWRFKPGQMVGARPFEIHLSPPSS